jgi:hypothetical protein
MNNYIDDYNNKLNKIAEIHRSNESKFKSIQEKANQEVSNADKLANDAYAADRAAKYALKKALESAKNAANLKDIKPDEKEIKRLENEIEEKVVIHTNALNDYKRINKETIEIMKYKNPYIPLLNDEIKKLIEKIKLLSNQTNDAYKIAQDAANNYDKNTLDTNQNLAIELLDKIKIVKKELDEKIKKMKDLVDEEELNKKNARINEKNAKQVEIKTKIDVDNIRIDNRRKIEDLINNAKINSEKQKVNALISAKSDAVKAEELEKKRKELEIKSNSYDYVSLGAEKNADTIAQELLQKNIEFWKGLNPKLYANFQTLDKNLID